MKLNLGCGWKKLTNFTNIDKSPKVKPDLILNLDNNQLPYPDNTIEEIQMTDFLEHAKNPAKLIEECWRVSKHNAKWKITVPHTSNNQQDTLHHKTKGFHKNTFKTYYANSKRKYYSKAILELESITYTKKGLQKLAPLFLRYFITNTVQSITYHLRAIKHGKSWCQPNLHPND